MIDKTKHNFYLVEFFFGLGLGMASSTSLRYQLIGFSELIILISLIAIMHREKFSLQYQNKYQLILIFFLLVSVFLILPTVTSYNFLFNPERKEIYFFYLLSFFFNCLLFLFLSNAIYNNNINIKKVIKISVITFLFVNTYSLLFDNELTHDSRFVGYSSNPNQLALYCLGFIIISIFYLSKKLLYLFLPLLFFYGISTKSDAFYLSIAILILVYSFLKFLSFFSNKFLSVKFLFFFITAALIIIILTSSEVLLQFWKSADEHNTRYDLYHNGIDAILKSPFFGYGSGIFSGQELAFEGMEAHNTFIDLGLQFGIILSLVIYFIKIQSFFYFVKEKKLIEAAAITSLVVFSLFHFVARHFIYWVILAIIYQFIRSYYKKNLNM